MATCQVAIIGAGPAGCAAAIALARSGIDGVVVFDAGRSARPQIGESLPPDIRPLLQQLGLWDAFTGQGHARCLGSCSAWGSHTLGYNDFVLNPLGPGWHLDRPAFDQWLAARVRAAGITLREARLVRAAVTNGHELQMRRGPHHESWRARFVIDASGTSARFSRLQGARRESLDQLFFVHGFFQRPPNAAENRLGMVESVMDGWWYRASLPRARLCIALACDQTTLRRRRLDHWRPWLDALAETRHVARGLEGHVFLRDEMRIMPAPSARLRPAVGNGWLAAGDAADSFDPLLARGIHKAIEDGIAAAAVITRWLRVGVDSAPDYRDALATRHAVYVRMREYFYAREARWPQAPFWRSRRPPAALAPSAYHTAASPLEA
jgi:flavin-dependent dehydrogenase